MGLTENVPESKRKKIYNTAVIVGTVLLLVFAFTGTEILNIFGLSIYSFEVAGGILLLIIAIRILIMGSMHENIESPESLGAVPIAIPLLVGPGAITTTIFQHSTRRYSDSSNLGRCNRDGNNMGYPQVHQWNLQVTWQNRLNSHSKSYGALNRRHRSPIHLNRYNTLPIVDTLIRSKQKLKPESKICLQNHL